MPKSTKLPLHRHRVKSHVSVIFFFFEHWRIKQLFYWKVTVSSEHRLEKCSIPIIRPAARKQSVSPHVWEDLSKIDLTFRHEWIEISQNNSFSMGESSQKNVPLSDVLLDWKSVINKILKISGRAVLFVVPFSTFTWRNFCFVNSSWGSWNSWGSQSSVEEPYPSVESRGFN